MINRETGTLHLERPYFLASADAQSAEAYNLIRESMRATANSPLSAPLHTGLPAATRRFSKSSLADQFSGCEGNRLLALAFNWCQFP